MYFVFFTGLRSHDIRHQSGELPGLGLHGTRRGFQCRVDPQGESSLPVHPTHPQPMERQQEGPDQQGWTGEKTVLTQGATESASYHRGCFTS